MASYSRFTDENYKNWLKTTMSLQLLRSSLYPFIENETETYHRSLLERFTDAFGNETCAKKCNNTKKRPNDKELPICKTCKWWRDQILENHNNKKGPIYWENSKPYLWSSNKWEVAKVYMPRGNQNHHEICQFDISAILNFMTFCRHFKKFAQGNVITEVTRVRNQMMHSPDMKVPKEDMEKHLGKILAFVKHLQAQAPELKLEVLLEEIDQLQNTELNIVLEGLEPKGDVIKDLLSVQRVQDLEQQVLKEKIECLNHRLEEDRNNLQTEEGFVQEVKAMKDFLEQNMDLLVQLGPQVEKLNSIEEKVDQHDQQLMDLTVKVDHLEKNKYEPVFSADSVKFKNHLLEEAVKNNWPVPVFSEIRHSNGYTGQVVVNGQTFKGLHIHPRVKAAHQEVSKIVLEQLLSSDMMKSSISAPPNDQSGTSTATVSGPSYFCSVTVTLNKEITVQEGHSGKEEAIQFAYQKLSSMFSLPVMGVSHKQAVQQYFARNGFQQPEEILNTGSDEKVYCKLKLSGPFTFQGKEGAGKKRLAEQQAAKEALLRLGRVIDYTGETGDNYKGTLKERLEALGLEQPIYKDIQTMERKGIEEETSMSEGKTSSGTNLKSADAEVSKSQQGTVTGQMTDPNASILKQETSVSPASPQFYAIVNVPVKIGFDGPEAPTKDHAVQAAYVALREALALGDPASAPPAGSARQLVLDFFRQAKCQFPVENYETTTEEKIKCRLDISGDLIFQNKEGVSKKQLAMQGAAKEALSRLARVMRWDLSGVNENYRGKLQELLAKQGQTPSYQSKPGEAETSSTHAVSDHSSAGAPIIQEISVSNADDLTTQPDESSQLPPPRKVPKIEAPEIKNLLRLSGLQPPFVNLESFSMEKRFECRVEIHLADYTFQNEVGYRTKKEAIRGAYTVFGQALGICDQNAEEILSVAAVKQYFSKRSFELPSEEVKEKEDKKFFCSIHVASCDFSYEGEGQSEEIARREASKRAFSQLSALFGYKVAASISSNEGLDDRLALMLKGAHQEKPVFKLTSTLYRGTVKLLFSNFTLAIKGKNNKKLTQHKLSERILGLLGENDTETSYSISTRNRVDEWFKQKRFQLPIFEDTEEQCGAKVTFSAPLFCCNPDWQVCCEDVERRLTEELKARFRYLIEEDTN